MAAELSEHLAELGLGKVDQGVCQLLLLEQVHQRASGELGIVEAVASDDREVEPTLVGGHGALNQLGFAKGGELAVDASARAVENAISEIAGKPINELRLRGLVSGRAQRAFELGVEKVAHGELRGINLIWRAGVAGGVLAS